MAKDDFFLSFGTDADIFADKIEGSSTRARGAIEQLIGSLEEYDQTVRNVKGGGPLNNLFTALDDAGAKFGGLTRELSESLGAALKGITGLKDELKGLVDSVNEINRIRQATRDRRNEGLSAEGVTAEELRVTDAARRKGKDLSEIIELNATQARLALRRVAEVNATVARNSDTAATALSNMAKQIREVIGATREARNRGTFDPGEGGGPGNASGPFSTPPGGGGNFPGGGHQVHTSGNIIYNITGPVTFNGGGGPNSGAAQLPTGGATVIEGSVVNNDTDAAAQLRGKRGVQRLYQSQYNEPAVSGRYETAPGVQRPVGFDVRPGETFGDYFKRNDEVRRALARGREQLPVPQAADLQLFQKFRQTGGRENNDVFERLSRNYGQSAVPIETLKASFEGISFGGLTKAQIKALPEVLSRISEVRAAQMRVALKTIDEILAKDPLATFQGDTGIGRQDLNVEVENTFAKALSEIDERIKTGRDARGGTVAAYSDIDRRGVEARAEASAKAAALRTVSGDRGKRRQVTRALDPSLLPEGLRPEEGDARARRNVEEFEFYGSDGRTTVDDRLKTPQTLAARITERGRLIQSAKQRLFKEGNKSDADANVIAALEEALAIQEQGLEDLYKEQKQYAEEKKKTASDRKKRIAEIQNAPKTDQEIADLVERRPEVKRQKALIEGGLSDADVIAYLDPNGKKPEFLPKVRPTTPEETERINESAQGKALQELRDKAAEATAALEALGDMAGKTSTAVLSLEEAEARLASASEADRAQAEADFQSALQRRRSGKTAGEPDYFEQRRAELLSRAEQASTGDKTNPELAAEYRAKATQTPQEYIASLHTEIADREKSLFTIEEQPTITDEQRERATQRAKDALDTIRRDAAKELGLKGDLPNPSAPAEVVDAQADRNAGTKGEKVSKSKGRNNSKLEEARQELEQIQAQIAQNSFEDDGLVAAVFQLEEEIDQLLTARNEKTKKAKRPKPLQAPGPEDFVDLYRAEGFDNGGVASQGLGPGRFYAENAQQADFYREIAKGQDVDPTLFHARVPRHVAEQYRGSNLNKSTGELLDHLIATDANSLTPAQEQLLKLGDQAANASEPSHEFILPPEVIEKYSRQITKEEFERRLAEEQGGGPAPEVSSNQPRKTNPGTRRIYRGESPDARPSSQAGEGADLQGKFFTEDEAIAREYAGENGRVVGVDVSEKTLKRARDRAIQNKVLEGLVVHEATARRARPVEELGPVERDTVTEADINQVTVQAETSKSSVGRERKNKGRLIEARESLAHFKELAEQDSFEADGLYAVIAELEEEIATLSAAREPKAAGSGGKGGKGGGGRKPRGSAGGAGGGDEPPSKPPNAAAAGEPDPDDYLRRGRLADVFGQDLSKKANRSTARLFTTDFTQQIKGLSETTQKILEEAKARLLNTKAIADENERLEAQSKILIEAGAALAADPHAKTFPGIGVTRGTFAQAVGLPPSKDNYGTLGKLFGKEGAIDGSGLANKAKAAADAPSSARGASEEGGSLGRALFGNRGFIDSQLRHVGQAIENFAGFQLVFTGFEKVKELVQTGLEADVTFVRLNATLQASGRNANGLRAAFGRISSETGESLKTVVEAAAELAGVFKNNADLVQGVKIATELANISQGTLSAKEAAIGLRDVTDAYAVSGAQGIQQVGDQIARLSVVTGVSVKDITEGATQLAQEAHDFGLGQRQAVVLTSFITKNTGETGTAAAEQTSRVLATLNSTKVQDQLVKLNIATREQFASGDIAGVLTNLLTNFDKLTPSAKQSIEALVGAGRQARAFTGLMRDGAAIVKEFNNSQYDLGALAKQNEAILGTVSGNIKQLSEDFRNLGQTLQQLGVFDILGVVAKSLDLLLQTVNSVGQGIADFFNSNPILKGFKDLTATILEAVVAFKILGPVAASALGKIGIGPAARAAKAAAVEAAIAEGGTAPAGFFAGGRTGQTFTQRFAPKGYAPFIGPLGSVSDTTRVSATYVGPDGQPYTKEGPAVLPPTAGRTFVNEEGQVARGRRPFGVLSGVGQRISGGAASAAAAIEARELGVVGTAAVKAANATKALGNQLTVLGETMVATGAETKAASVQSGLLNGALIGLAIAIPLIISGFQKEKEDRKNLNAVIDDLTGSTPDASKDDPTGADKTRTDANAAVGTTSYGKAYKDFITGGPAGTGVGQRLLNIGKTILGVSPLGLAVNGANGVASAAGDLLSGNFGKIGGDLSNVFSGLTAGAGSGGVTSGKFDKAEGKLQSELFKKLRDAKTPEEEAKALAEVNKELQDQSKNLIKSAGDQDAQKSAAADLENLKSALNNAGDHRIQTLKGVASIDVLNAKQIVGIGTLAQTVSQLNKQTLAQVGTLLAELESDTGLAQGSKTDNNFKTSIDPNKTAAERRRATIANLQDSLAQGQDKLANDAAYKAGPARDSLIQALEQQAQTLSQLQQQELQSGQALGAAQADFLEKAGTPAAAAAAMRTSVDGIVSILATLDSTQPEYFQALSQLMDAELKAANLDNLTGPDGLNALKLDSSNTLNSVKKANDAKKIADLNLKAAKKAAADADPKIQAAAQADLDKQQAEVDRITAEQKAADPSDRKFFNNALDAAIAKRDAAKKTLADAKKQSGPDNPAVRDAQIAANEAALQAAQAQADQDLSGSQLQQAIIANTGDAAGAAKQELIGLQGKAGDGGALAAAIKNYGTDSAQANQIRIQIIDAKKKQDDALLDILNASLELEIAQLNARGKQGDAEAAAKDQTQEAQNAIDAYKKRTGDKKLANPEGQRLQASLVTAQRNQFDVALNAQLDTLDFQKETYQITSSQEVQALQEILKNKQLTLKEQRDITLKIKNLQDSVRQQLTGGGFNIPTDIKLPTAFQVRRSLGGGFGNGGSNTTVNNTNTSSVNINNNVPTAAVAHQIANQVIAVINAQTGQSARANTSTPRLVGP